MVAAAWPLAARTPKFIALIGTPRDLAAPDFKVPAFLVRNSTLQRSKRPTAWLRMQSEAKRSRGRISLQFAICTDIFRNCRENRFVSCETPNNLNILGETIPTQGAGSILGYCREEQRGIAD